MKEFWDDKKREKSSIDDTIRLLTQENMVFVKENNDKDFDLLFKKDNKEVKIEVKQDFSCFLTGNVGVEYHCRGKQSGIMASKADLYVYKLHQNPKFYNIVPEIEKTKNEISIFLIDKKKLKDCINQILEEDKVEEETKREYEDNNLKYTSPFKPSQKKNFYIRKIFDKSNGKYYFVSIRKINGGDIGSNSLNILFERFSFVRNFALKELESRARNEMETNDLNETLNNKKEREKERYNK